MSQLLANLEAVKLVLWFFIYTDYDLELKMYKDVRVDRCYLMSFLAPRLTAVKGCIVFVFSTSVRLLLLQVSMLVDMFTLHVNCWNYFVVI